MCAAVPWWPMLFVSAGENDHDFWNELVQSSLLHLASTRDIMNQSPIIWGYRQELSSTPPCSTGRWKMDLDYPRWIDAIQGAAI
jgi:hypothetical protein